MDDIKKIAKMLTILVVPARMEDDAKELANDVASIVTVKPGVYKEISGLEVETIPAYNTVKPFHPRRAEWVEKHDMRCGDLVYEKNSRRTASMSILDC